MRKQKSVGGCLSFLSKLARSFEGGKQTRVDHVGGAQLIPIGVGFRNSVNIGTGCWVGSDYQGRLIRASKVICQAGGLILPPFLLEACLQLLSKISKLIPRSITKNVTVLWR